MTPTAEEQRRLAELRQRAAVIDKAIQQTADAADAAEKAAQMLVLPVEWDFRPDPGNEGEAARWFAVKPDAHWTKLRVDLPWTKQTHGEFGGAGWYAITFDTPSFVSGQRVFVRFGAVNGTCRVWLDGKQAGERTLDPAYVRRFPLALDVTGLLRPSTTHRLVLQVVGNSTEAGLIQPIELRVLN